MPLRGLRFYRFDKVAAAFEALPGEPGHPPYELVIVGNRLEDGCQNLPLPQANYAKTTRCNPQPCQ